MEARRLLVVSVGQMFQFRAVEQPAPDRKGVQPVLVEITVDFGKGAPTLEQVDTALSKIFLTANESLGDLVPNYWKPCVRAGLAGKDQRCRFASELTAVPGVTLFGANDMGTASDSASTSEGLETKPTDSPPKNTHGVIPPTAIFRVGGGVSAPRVIYQVDPEFSESARRYKFQGTVTVTMDLVVSKDGLPTHIYILSPQGSGLDAKAVEALQGWKFYPAKKDGQPVAVEIAVEMDFHLN